MILSCLCFQRIPWTFPLCVLSIQKLAAHPQSYISTFAYVWCQYLAEWHCPQPTSALFWKNQSTSKLTDVWVT